jgi:hypothetical protein
MSDISIGAKKARKRERVEDYRPERIEPPPLFVWPVRPLSFVRWFFGFPGFLWPWNTLYLTIAAATWFWLTPSLGSMQRIETWWVCLLLLRNAALITVVVGAWHIRLYVQQAQGTRFKYNGRWLAQDNDNFLFSD